MARATGTTRRTRPRARVTAAAQQSQEVAVLSDTYPDPIQRLMSTNTPLLDAELAQLRDALDKAQRHLSELSANPNSDKGNKTNRQKKLEVSRLISVYKAILSPIRRIPAEIVSEVLLHVFGHYEEAPQSVTFDVTTGVWLFGRISRQWRAVVLSLSPLWSYIHIDVGGLPLPRRFLPASKQYTSILNACLERSGSHLLTITIDNPPCPSPADLKRGDWGGRISTVLLERIARECRRWRDIRLTLTSSTKVAKSIAVIQGKVPFLQHFSLISHFRNITPKDFPSDLLLDAPCLQSIAFTNFKDFQSIQLPWSQITRADLSSCSLGNNLQLLAAMCNITQFIYSDSYGLAEDAKPGVSLQLPQLHTLSIDDARVVDQLVMPTLTNLSVDFADDEADVQPVPRDEGFSIKALRIEGGYTILGASVMEYSKWPALTRLYIEAPYVESFISRLTVRADRDVQLLPALTHLALGVWIEEGDEEEDYGTWPSLDCDPIFAMVRSRNQARDSHARLQSFRFRVRELPRQLVESLRSSTRNALEQFRKDGVDSDVEMIFVDDESDDDDIEWTFAQYAEYLCNSCECSLHNLFVTPTD